MNFQWISSIEHVLNLIPGQWRFVGGCVRDSLLGINTYDIDISTLVDCDQIESILGNLFTINNIGKKFGTIGVYYKGWSIEITTARKDVENFGRHANVDFENVNFEDDSNRRDFTINALMMDEENLYDYHDGINDLINRQIKFVGTAQERIQEDYLRIMRYVRFFVRFTDGINYDKNNILPYVANMKNLSKERIIKEMESMCKHKNTGRAFEIMNELEISQLFFLKNLNISIDDDLSVIEKMSYALLNVNICNWPVNRNVKRICSFKVSEFNDEYMTYLWNKYKDIQIIKEYNDLLKYLKLPVVDFDLNGDLSLSEQFQGKDRGIAAFVIRYYIIKKQSINYEFLLNNKDKIYKEVFNKLKTLK